MTKKELLDKLQKWFNDPTSWDRVLGCYLPEIAKDVDELDDRAEEMIEWAKTEYQRGRKEWMNKAAWDDETLKFWEGYWWSLNKMVQKFTHRCPHCGKVIDD